MPEREAQIGEVTTLEAPEPVLDVVGLRVDLPDGRSILDGVDLTVARGEVVAILGPSGSGKSTLGRALFEPDTLLGEGMQVLRERVEMPSAALVPQRGAPFDHLDVRGNVGLVLRWHGAADKDPREWLEAVGLEGPIAAGGSSTSHLSGGQAQRLAAARALAAGRSLLFLDEPSAGLDTRATSELAELLRRQAEDGKAGVVIVTHDTSLAAESADRCLLLDPSSGTLRPLPSPKGDRTALESVLRERLAAVSSPDGPRARSLFWNRPGLLLRRLWERTLAPLTVPPLVLAALASVRRRHLGPLLRVAWRVTAQALIRPAAFYAVVALLLGFTVLYVLVRAAPAGLSSAALLELVGGSYVLALAPPLSALLFVATSGSAVSAWLGSLSLSRQTTAMEALGISSRVYLWLPVYLATTISFLLVAALVAAGLILGGALLHMIEGVYGPSTLALLAGDLLDPVPERASLRARALWLVAIYGPGISADLVHRGTSPKSSAEAVTKGMTGSVIACTLWVVALELVAALILFAGNGVVSG